MNFNSINKNRTCDNLPIINTIRVILRPVNDMKKLIVGKKKDMTGKKQMISNGWVSKYFIGPDVT